MEEIWKPVVGYEGLYMVSNLGRVWSVRKKRFLKEYVDKRNNKLPYHRVVLQKNGMIDRISVHRLVAEAFIPNPDNLPQVNHKDENPENNCVDNLEWCTAKYNLEYNNGQKRRGKTNLNGKKSKQIIQYTLDGNFIKEWPSVKELERHNYRHISECCLGKRKTAYGYIWKYK